MIKYIKRANILFLCFVVLSGAVSAQTTKFTYQGKLTDAGTPSATYDFEFRLCDTLAADCSAPLAVQQISGVPVSGGVFTVTLNFPAVNFDGNDRFLEIAVKRPAQGSYTTLVGRQKITSAPYAIRSLIAANADNADNAANSVLFGGLTTDSFVQNTTTQQTGNFNLSGDGTLGGTFLANRVGINVASLQAGVNLDLSGNSVFRTANGNVNIGTPNSETGMTISNGTSRADLRFDGTTLKLVAGPSGIPSATNGIVINTLGDVGIGTATPAAKLDINALSVDGLKVSSNNQNAVNAVNIGAGSGISGFALSNTSGARGVYGLSNGGIGVEGVSNGGNNFGVFASGFLGTNRLGTGGGTQLCLNFSNQVATCGSSLRYKKDLQNFSGGLSFINQLRPIAYKWKTDNIADVGFGAEDVAKINPLFVTYNDKGEVEGVKYDRLSVVFVNAFKEQQAQIEQQQKQIERQQQQIDALTRLVCSQNPQAEICREQ